MGKIKKLFKWIWQQLKDPINLIIYICVAAVFFSPAVIGYVLAIITKNAWHTTYATAYMLFWAGPFTPTIPLQISITLGIRKLLKTIKNKGRR